MELGTALAVIAFADQCLKYGSKFVKRCKSYLHAEEEALELLYSIESNWVKMETQIEVLKRVVPSLDKRLQDSQSRTLSQLEGKLKTASLIIEQLQKMKTEHEKATKHRPEDEDIATVIEGLKDMRALKKARFVLEKTRLYDIVDDIEKWQARFDPTWIFIMQLSNDSIDKELNEQQKKHGQLPIVKAAKGIRDVTRVTRLEQLEDRGSIWIQQLDLKPSGIPYSVVQSSILQSQTDSVETVIIDTMACNPTADAGKTAKGVRDLARALAQVDPFTFSLLKCRGVIKISKELSQLDPPSPCFKFIFNVPPGLSKPQSLRTVLLSGKSPSLDERLDLAKRLAGSILYMHTIHFVHKNIRPENIITFQNERSNNLTPFLVGFEQSRLEDGNTFRSGDNVWQHDLYRHPSRQGTHPQVDYAMQHDIYSLGVVLLEIGLWTSFVLYGLDDKISLPVPNRILEQGKQAQPQKILSTASANKLKLEDLATKELPLRLGKRYTNIVLLCLQCLDEESKAKPDVKGFGVNTLDWADQDGITIGVKYIENVLENLQQIHI